MTLRRSAFAVSSQRRPSVVGALFLIGALNSVAGLSGTALVRAAAVEAAPAPIGPQLRAVSATLGDTSTTLTIEASDPVAYLMSQPDPFTLLIDLRNARSVGAINNVQSRFGQVAGVTLEDAMAPDGGRSARIRVRFNAAVPFNVRSARNLIVVEVGTGGQPAVAAGPAPADLPAVRPAAAPEAIAQPPLFAAQIGERRPLSPPEPMTALTLRPRGTEPASAATGLSNDSLRILSPAAVTSAAPSVPVPAPASRAPAGSSTLASGGRGVAVAQLQAATGQTPAAPATAGVVQQTLGQTRTFTGQPVILDFQGADLRAVLRTFAEISGLNMVIDPTVQGSVDVALRDVPWDQALDTILRANKLGYVVDGTIVRIAPITVLSDEESQRRKLAEEQALAGELRVFTRSLSYAKAEDLAPLLTRTALTTRGTVQVDPRTNTLIITDLPAALQTVGDLIGTLDRAQPQVEIEARIVQTTRDFARSLGVQWGFNGRVATDLGNTTGLAFPNQGTLTGRAGPVQGPIQGTLGDHAATAVNLGVEGASNAIGLALGSVNGALNLDVALSALERSGQGRLLSTPRVSTQNNVEAEITQGVQIPIQTVANNTVTVTFKDAALTLKVTPQITASDTVIMRISVENASPDFSRSIKDIPPIDTQRAITQVLVSDGQTTVIGGIYTSREESAEDRTPGLHRLPLLGWLFRRETIRDESRELLIFITPRIIRT